MSSTMVHVRVDEDVKEKTAATLKKMGMSVSDAVRILLVRIAAEEALPFEVRVPNEETIKAMRSADRKEGRRFASTSEVRTIILGSAFKRDTKRMQRRGRQMGKLRELVYCWSMSCRCTTKTML